MYVDESAHFDPRGEVTVSEENVESTRKRARPAWLTDYSLHMNIIGVLSSPPGSPPSEEAEPVERSESDALMDSLSPGVRASYEGWLLEREHARRSGRARNAEMRATSAGRGGVCGVHRGAASAAQREKRRRHMTEPNSNTRTIVVVLALIAAFEIFRPAPAMTQPSVADHLRDVVFELRGIRQELSGIQRKMK